MQAWDLILVLGTSLHSYANVCTYTVDLYCNSFLYLSLFLSFFSLLLFFHGASKRSHRVFYLKKHAAWMLRTHCIVRMYIRTIYAMFCVCDVPHSLLNKIPRPRPIHPEYVFKFTQKKEIFSCKIPTTRPISVLLCSSLHEQRWCVSKKKRERNVAIDVHKHTHTIPLFG